MEENRLYLREKYNMRDSLTPNGYVIIKTQDGEIIYEGHNMVVATGRKLLRNIFMNPTDEGLSFSSLFAYFGNNTEMAAANDTWGDNGYSKITNIPASPVSIPANVWRLKTPEEREEADESIYTSVDSADNDEFMAYFSDSSGTLVAPDKNTLYYMLNDTGNYIHMGIRYALESDATPIQISTFGLAFEESSENKLFSRIVFPTRTISTNTPIVIDYYLYF